MGVVEEQAEYQKIVNQKYQAIIKRSFKTKLELFLFNECVKTGGLNNISSHRFQSFKIETNIINHYESTWQIKEGKATPDDKLDVLSIDKLIDEWNANNEELKKEMLAKYSTNFKRDFTIELFKAFYPNDKELRKCKYCDISEKDIEELKSTGKILTKRARGNTMEIDRLNSNKEYTIDNIVLACYWCNNSKTDEFTFEESTDHLGPAIKTIWAHRLDKPPDG